MVQPVPAMLITAPASISESLALLRIALNPDLGKPLVALLEQILEAEAKNKALVEQLLGPVTDILRLREEADADRVRAADAAAEQIALANDQAQQIRERAAAAADELTAAAAAHKAAAEQLAETTAAAASELGTQRVRSDQQLAELIAAQTVLAADQARNAAAAEQIARLQARIDAQLAALAKLGIKIALELPDEAPAAQPVTA